MRPAVLLLAAALAGCAAEARRTLPPEIRTVALGVLRNDTPEPLLASLLAEELRRAFRLDGRLAVAEAGAGADAELSGTLKSYERLAARYDANNVVQEYRLRLVVELSLASPATGTAYGAGPRTFDRSAGLVVVPASGLPVESEPDAQRRLARELAREAVSRVLERW